MEYGDLRCLPGAAAFPPTDHQCASGRFHVGEKVRELLLYRRYDAEVAQEAASIGSVSA